MREPQQICDELYMFEAFRLMAEFKDTSEICKMKARAFASRLFPTDMLDISEQRLTESLNKWNTFRNV